MQKKISLLMVVVLALTALLAACAPQAAPTAATTEAAAPVQPADDTKSVGFTTPTTASGFMAMVAGELESRFKAAGYEWNIGIADGDSKKQIDQIENFITLGVDTIVVMAVEPTSLTDVLQKATDQGIKVINFTTDSGVGDVFIGSDEKLVGETVAQIASEWIDATFPNAGPGEVKVAVMEFRDTPEASHRSDGLAAIANNSKVTVVKFQSGNTAAAAQAVAENMLLTDPDVKAVLTYNSAMSLGVNTYVMSPGSAVADKSQFGVFGADITEEVAAAILASGSNESVLRGVTQLGGNIMEVFDNIVKFSDALLAGESVPARDIAEVYKVTLANIEEKIAELYPNLK